MTLALIGKRNMRRKKENERRKRKKERKKEREKERKKEGKEKKRKRNIGEERRKQWQKKNSLFVHPEMNSLARTEKSTFHTRKRDR